LVKIISLTQGMETLVDDEDFEFLSKKKWFFCLGYARRTFHRGKGKGTQDPKAILMHREILNVNDGEYVDHINGNRLDNRRSNLRKCTIRQNNQNIGIKSTNTSGYKGVSWKKDKNKWKAYITLNNKQKHLGYFEKIEDAAIAYNNAAKMYFNEFARLNNVVLS